MEVCSCSSMLRFTVAMIAAEGCIDSIAAIVLSDAIILHEGRLLSVSPRCKVQQF